MIQGAIKDCLVSSEAVHTERGRVGHINISNKNMHLKRRGNMMMMIGLGLCMYIYKYIYVIIMQVYNIISISLAV